VASGEAGNEPLVPGVETMRADAFVQLLSRSADIKTGPFPVRNRTLARNQIRDIVNHRFPDYSLVAMRHYAAFACSSVLIPINAIDPEVRHFIYALPRDRENFPDHRLRQHVQGSNR
jgi:hypothetical protein